MSDEDDIQWCWGDDERDLPEERRRSREQKIAVVLIVISALIMMYSFLAVALTEMSMQELMGIEDRVVEITK